MLARTMDVMDNPGVQFLLIVFASLMLWKGAEWMVDALARIAKRFNISDLVIGLTFVAFGTSAPELAVSIGAALRGQADISVGNVVGSNIFNLGIILGGCAAVRPIITSRALVYRDGLFLVAVTLMLATFITDLQISRFEGVTMIALLFAYMSFLFFRRTSPDLEGADESVTPVSTTGAGRDAALAVGSLVVVLAGAHLLVMSASGLARSFGLSEWTIAVTIVAAGTSAPEVVTALAAVFRGHHGISAGGLVGSDLYNLLGVLGVAAVIRPLAVDANASPSVWVLVVMVGVVIVFMRTGWRVSRREGLVLFCCNLARFWFDVR